MIVLSRSNTLSFKIRFFSRSAACFFSKNNCISLYSSLSTKSNSHFDSSFSLSQPLDVSVDYLIIGGGVVGLAIAERLSKRKGKSTLLVEKNFKVNEETSSRNSEVIHAGLYYPNNSLKTHLCIRGKRLLYSLLFSNYSGQINYNDSTIDDSFIIDSSLVSASFEKSKSLTIPYYRTGKWIVAQNDDESTYLTALQEKSTIIGVPTYFLSEKLQKSQEPHVNAIRVLVSPTTGIIDSHAFINWLEWKIEDNNGNIAVNSKVTNIIPGNDGDNRGYIVEITSASSTPKTKIFAKSVINSAGLYSDKIANMILPPSHHYKLYHVKGHYYGYRGSDLKVNHLIYPVPPKNLANLGIHLTLDLNGRIRFGPDVLYIQRSDDYEINDDESRKDTFFNAVKTYLPTIKIDKLYADYTGIRPKLSGPGEPFKDFVIKEEIDCGFDGFVNLVGIESPGLTSSLAIGEMVDNILKDR
ncbi:FAD dependent oxidoreductase [Gigaspora margarita]|uniref:L-2-hydroxyglutarate dehydrogenase, mitochondrial n=1 Tax=Gigaspora margarita TaxID=4874 RepID=A0A8H4AE72_GIGMA|nr:FAD dependent oxidoreductase [Gigaspora margarita]